jgi:hypothetical protein
LAGVELLTSEAREELGLPVSGTGEVDTTTVKCSAPPPEVRTSVLEFVDTDWVHPAAHAIALTTVDFCVRSGRILGADMELNSAEFNLTLPEQVPEFDLLSVLTHESGHFLGLDDLPNPGPTMSGHYSGGEDLGPRSLEADDEAGLCAVYPQGRFDAEEGCGCRVVGRSTRNAGLGWLAAAFIALAFARGRRRVIRRS